MIYWKVLETIEKVSVLKLYIHTGTLRAQARPAMLFSVTAVGESPCIVVARVLKRKMKSR